MLRALYTAATGMNAQELNIDVISNNLANINTTAYKKSRADFQDLVYQYIVEPGAGSSADTANPSGISVGLGVEPVAVHKVFEQGDLKSTGRNLDVAIEGDGFFQVELPNGGGPAFTRAGTFQLDINNQLVTPEGYILTGAPAIDPTSVAIEITSDGFINIRTPGQAAATQAGQLPAFRFPNPSGLKAMGQNLYLETQAAGAPLQGNWGLNGFGRLNQGFLETSNVSVVEQVVNMITAQRAYEASSKGVQSADEILGQAINLKR